MALRSRGLGSAWTTLHLAYEQEAAALLDIPDTVTQVALIPVTHYTGTDFRPADRLADREGHLPQRMAEAVTETVKPKP